MKNKSVFIIVLILVIVFYTYILYLIFSRKNETEVKKPNSEYYKKQKDSLERELHLSIDREAKLKNKLKISDSLLAISKQKIKHHKNAINEDSINIRNIPNDSVWIEFNREFTGSGF